MTTSNSGGSWQPSGPYGQDQENDRGQSDDRVQNYNQNQFNGRDQYENRDQSGQCNYPASPNRPDQYSPQGFSSNDQQPYGQQSHDQQPYGQFPSSHQPYGQAPYNQQPGSHPQYSDEVARYGQYGEASSQALERNRSVKTIIPLRPLNVAETIDAATRALRFNPLALIVLPALIYMTYGLVSAVASGLFGEISTTSTAGFGASIRLNDGAALISFVTSLLVGTFVALASSRSTVASVKGRKLSLPEAFRLGTARILPSLGSFILLGLVGIVLAAIGFVVVALILGSLVSGFAEVNSLTGAIFFFTLIAFSFVLVMGTLLMPIIIAMPVVAVEGAGPSKALKRSYKLISGSYGYLVAVFLACTAIIFVISITLSLGFSFLASVFSTTGVSGVGAALAVAFMVIIYSILVPFVTAAMNIAYINLRFRAEGWHNRILSDR